MGLGFLAPAAAQSAPDAAAADPPRVNTVLDAVRAIPVAPATIVRPAGPMPATNPGTWVTPADYPAWAIRYDVTGRVGFRLDVGSDGRASHCEVTLSSGVPDLDAVACEKVLERARFVPARNDAGEPVSGTWSTTVVWAIPEDEGDADEAPQPGYLVTTMIVEADGRVSDCRIERAEGAASQFPDDCPAGRSFDPILDADGKPQRTRIRLMLRLVHEPLP